MSEKRTANDLSLPETEDLTLETTTTMDTRVKGRGWRRFFRPAKPAPERNQSTASMSDGEGIKGRPEKWSLGVLNDKSTIEVPGSILMMSKETKHNEPLGLQNTPERMSSSSLPPSLPLGSRDGPRPGPSPLRQSEHVNEEKKKTANGDIILEPQPDDSLNDPLNWPSWRRDVALLSLGFFCMLGGGMTPVLAAGYQNVAKTYDVTIAQVALTTGFYQLGLGVGSVVSSPTAILFGKRPVYLYNLILFTISAVWCAVSPNYISLVVARVFMGFSLSPCECLPSATIAEIFFLHERAYRLGIYTLLLLSGKNLIPLISAVIIESLSWEWVFWIVAITAGLSFGLIFLFVPETFWDRTPIPHVKHKRPTLASLSSMFHHQSHQIGNEKTASTLNIHGGVDPEDTRKPHHSEKASSTHRVHHGGDGAEDMRKLALARAAAAADPNSAMTIAERRKQKISSHSGFVDDSISGEESSVHINLAGPEPHTANPKKASASDPNGTSRNLPSSDHLRLPEGATDRPLAYHSDSWKIAPHGEGPKTPGLHNLNSPFYLTKESPRIDYISNEHDLEVPKPFADESERSTIAELPLTLRYTHHLRTQPPKTFVQSLRPWNGRLRNDKWLKVAIRPFILYAYPSILWSTLIYSLSIGWLIVLSETVSVIYRNPQSYNFSALGTGLVYISPFIGGVLGTAVAGKLSDVIVRFMSRRNGGVYEPEFRLVMAIPVAIATVIGLMGFGWSAEEKDKWIVPTVFFGIISFGCALGSTTAITFAVDSYRQYAGEALVTLNFSKNMFGLAFALFFNNWLSADGSKTVFVYIGAIQIICLSTTIPMYIFGKRARMWTVRKNLMERF